MKKYEFTGETKKICGKTLQRIRARISFGNVSSGDIGGWVENEENLSHDGDAWVSGDANVYGNAKVYGNALISGDAWVYGNALISGDAWVYGDYDYTTIKGFGTEFRNTTFFRCSDKKVRVNCGCFHGTIEEFRNQVKKTRTGKIAKEYLRIAYLMEYHFSEYDNENRNAKVCMYNDGGYCRSCVDLRNSELGKDCVDYANDDIKDGDE